MFGLSPTTSGRPTPPSGHGRPAPGPGYYAGVKPTALGGPGAGGGADMWHASHLGMGQAKALGKSRFRPLRPGLGQTLSPQRVMRRALMGGGLLRALGAQPGGSMNRLMP